MIDFDNDNVNFIDKINTLAVCGLKERFEPKNQDFGYRWRESNGSIVSEGNSFRYTLISLLGLSRYENNIGHSPIDIKKVLGSVISKIHGANNVGDLGLLIWACAMIEPAYLKEIPIDTKIEVLNSKYEDFKFRKTTELSWLLTGLSLFLSLNVEQPQGIKELTEYVYKIVRRNYGGKGIFGHQGLNSITGLVRGRIGSFADQVYPIYAFCKFALVRSDSDALKIAQECGEKICEHQGPFGQWWWHYDAMSGKVIGRYPVYSVHQDGMAPMALYELQRSTGGNIEPNILKGLRWISGDNEQHFNLIDFNRNVIWRSFYRNRYNLYFDELKALIGFQKKNYDYDDLVILKESRPYCLGWLLYAFADKGSLQRSTKGQP